MNCPICEAKMEYQQQSCPLGVEESINECPNKCYIEQYAYGNTEIYVGNVIFRYSYLDNDEIIKLINKEIKAVIEIEKEYYKKKEND